MLTAHKKIGSKSPTRKKEENTKIISYAAEFAYTNAHTHEHENTNTNTKRH